MTMTGKAWKFGNDISTDLIIPGKSKKEILISTNICHPSMANNELSGIVVAMGISKYLKKFKRNYSYRILFIPETIGAINFIHDNYSQL